MDQVFSQEAAVLARHEFSTPEDVLGLMDDTFKLDALSDQIRKQAKKIKTEAYARKLDQVARWKDWVGALGIRLKGLRALAGLDEHYYVVCFFLVHVGVYALLLAFVLGVGGLSTGSGAA